MVGPTVDVRRPIIYMGKLTVDVETDSRREETDLGEGAFYWCWGQIVDVGDQLLMWRDILLMVIISGLFLIRVLSFSTYLWIFLLLRFRNETIAEKSCTSSKWLFCSAWYVMANNKVLSCQFSNGNDILPAGASRRGPAVNWSIPYHSVMKL